LSVALFPGRPRPPPQSNKREQLPASVTSTRLGTINPIPIDYGCRPRLREPAHPARINLAQEPLDFRREGLSPSLPLLMSAFSLPIPPACLTTRLHRPTERSATTSEDRTQKPEGQNQLSSGARHHPNFDAAPAASSRSPDTHLANAAMSAHRYNRDHGNNGSTRASRRWIQLPSEQSGETPDPIRAAWQSLPPSSHKSICSRAGNDRLAWCTSSETR
jgi:hypothetical protein